MEEIKNRINKLSKMKDEVKQVIIELQNGNFNNEQLFELGKKCLVLKGTCNNLFSLILDKMQDTSEHAYETKTII